MSQHFPPQIIIEWHFGGFRQDRSHKNIFDKGIWPTAILRHGLTGMGDEINFSLDSAKAEDSEWIVANFRKLIVRENQGMGYKPTTSAELILVRQRNCPRDYMAYPLNRVRLMPFDGHHFRGGSRR